MRICAGSRPRRAAAQARFALQNFVFGQQDRLPTAPHVRGLRATITPVAEYIARSGRLRRYGGIGQTAWCDITDPAHPQGPLTPEAAEDLMNELIHPLSLALGTLVSWHECQALDISGSPIEVIHRSKVTRAFSYEVVSMGWQAPVPGVVSAWFAQLDDVQNASASRMSSDELVVRLRHHIDACATDSYMETRALSAATLLDVLAERHAELIGKDNTLAPEQWTRDVSHTS
jgi:hypothetical protein